MIDIKGLCKRFGENEVLRGIDLLIADGTTTVILGGSGSGKSVLVKHIIGLLKPDGGSVLVDGVDVQSLGERELAALRRKFGMVFQGAALFDSMTVRENVAFPLVEHGRYSTGEIDRVVSAKLALLGLAGTEDKFPASLSGGMKKRVGLARAIVFDPPIILYDEPTTGLDPIMTDNVNDMIIDAKTKLGVTSVVISHDIGSAFKVADRIAVLCDGVIAVEGTPAEVRGSEHPYVKKFFGSWLERN